MKKIQLLLLLSILILTACGGESQPEQQELPAEQEPIVEPTQEQPAPEQPAQEEASPEEPAPEEPASEVAIIDDSVAVPTSLKISSKASDVQLSWGYIAEASSYNIYYSEAGDVDENSMSFSTPNTRFSHQGLNSSIHNYKIQAVYDEKQVTSALSNTLHANLAKPVKIQD
ncbi:hypothetical protein RI844_11625 [Thalassotalea fonticola]|uniref:Fibronectin type III domain-containing protein n=1 Tax=Thalassotalea fonticola TaxID=3065649 RepID=A0ABZ0GKF2_9GAMM|nr:hypothetical protein RI844_11625 [Colwelliaceae bacterium S1-1]